MTSTPQSPNGSQAQDYEESTEDEFDDRIAVVGLAGRFPGAPDIETFWENLVNEVDSLHTFTDDELRELGIPDSILEMENFVRRGTILPDHDRFDAKRFGFSPREAAMTDPQARVFLETVHDALEHAGHNPFDVPGEVGVFAGCNPVDYALLLGRPDGTDSLSAFDQMIGTDREFLATRVAHRLGLQGPAINVQSACSTSLVAIHLAAQHLLDFQCSTAVAGGVSINLRQGVGYFYQQGMILSPDGVCRAFDNDANGTTLGQGSGAVVLRRLADALEDSDTIHAVIAASALNNDGDRKISFTAPSVEGQAEVIATTHALADLSAEDITYIETHGTGTKLGDPVEIAGLTRAFRLTTQAKGFCAIGSVKTSVGHTDAAAGVTGFIKAVLAVREGLIPATLNFTEPNEAINFDDSPFYVATTTQPWEPTTTDIRRAGVSSFGIGGTNAHVLIEEAPEVAVRSDAQAQQTPLVLVGSGPSPEAALLTGKAFATWVSDHGGISVDSATTLITGRRHWSDRCSRTFDPTTGTLGAVRTGAAKSDATAVWMFSGQGAQFPGMASGMYEVFATFTAVLDSILDDVKRCSGFDLRPLLLGTRDDETAAATLKRTELTQPALFACQVATARQLQAWGLEPAALAGHSIGEFAAGVIAGIFSQADATRAVCERGRLMQSMEPGAMIATRLSTDKLRTLLPTGVDLASDNSSTSSVAAGPFQKIEELEEILNAQSLDFQRLATSHAFHSASMDDAAISFERFLQDVVLRAPSIPMLSNVTGTWMTAENAVKPSFWASQIRNPVLFESCLAELAQDDHVLVEVGPGRSLSAFASSHDKLSDPTTVQCLGHPRDQRSGSVIALDAVGQMWLAGLEPDWSSIYNLDTRNVPAPRSGFDRKEYWLPEARHVLALPPGDDVAPSVAARATGDDLTRLDVGQWCYGRSWRRLPTPNIYRGQRVLVLRDDSPTNAALVAGIRQQAAEVIEVHLGVSTDLSGARWTLAPGDEEGTQALLKRLTGTSRNPDRVIHLWLASTEVQTLSPESTALLDSVEEELLLGMHTLHCLARNLAPLSQDRPVQLDVVTSSAHQVLTDEPTRPARTAIAGPVKVIPLEYSGIAARQIDLPASPSSRELERCIAETLSSGSDDPIIAIRGLHSWSHDVCLLPPPVEQSSPIQRHGLYIIFGGLGGVGLSIAEHLASRYEARIVLVGRGGAPTPDPTNPETTRRLERLASVRSQAESLSIKTGDVTNAEQISSMIESIEAEFGEINGIMLTAAVADTEGAIHRRTPEAATRAISAKAHGATVIAQAFEDKELDFVLLSSSIASQLYHNRFGQVGYVTANSFAEGMAESGLFRAKRVVTVAWDDWVDIGMSVRAAQDFADQYGDDISLMDEIHSFSPADGIRVFEQALSSEEATIFVSTTDLATRIRNDGTEISPFLAQALRGEEGGHDEATGTVQEVVRSTWESLLGLSEFEDSDDFFDLGGDSLQVARMADRFGRLLELEIALDLIFDNPTLAGLTAALETISSGTTGGSPTQTNEPEIRGVLKLSPPQQRFFDRGSVAPQHFNVSVLMQPLRTGAAGPRSIELGDLGRAFQSLVTRHSALRTSFEPTVHAVAGVQSLPSTQIRQHIAEPTDAASIALEQVPVESIGEHADPLLADHCQRVHASFDLGTAPLAKAVLFETPSGDQQLFLVVHHLVSDRVSLLSMIDDLDALLAGDELAGATAPYSNWARAVEDFGQSDGAEDLIQTWDQKIPTALTALPVDQTAANLNADADAIHVDLDTATSDMLLRGDEGRVDEQLLLSLADALGTWATCNDSDDHRSPVGIDVLGHGRRDLRDFNVSRTAGFFLSYSPVWVDSRLSCSHAIEALRTQLKTAWTFDALRFAHPAQTRHWVKPQVLFNFVGRPVSSDDARVLEVVEGSKGSDTNPANVRDHELAVMAEITRQDQVRLTIVFGSKRIPRSSIENLALELTQSIARIAGGLVPNS